MVNLQSDPLTHASIGGCKSKQRKEKKNKQTNKKDKKRGKTKQKRENQTNKQIGIIYSFCLQLKLSDNCPMLN